jgi:hypothetical protein
MNSSAEKIIVKSGERNRVTLKTLADLGNYVWSIGVNSKMWQRWLAR